MRPSSFKLVTFLADWFTRCLGTLDHPKRIKINSGQAMIAKKRAMNVPPSVNHLKQRFKKNFNTNKVEFEFLSLKNQKVKKSSLKRRINAAMRKMIIVGMPNTRRRAPCCPAKENMQNNRSLRFVILSAGNNLTGRVP